jgi:hypothetical protein
MAELVPVRGGHRVPLESHNLVGRSRACVLRLEDPRVSKVHAQLQWSGARWELRDLDSKNGTWVDGRRLDSGQRVEVEDGAELAFGSRDHVWRLRCDGAPQAFAHPEDGGEVVIGESDLLALPCPDDPQLSIYRAPEGGGVAEGVGAIADGERVEAGGRAWIVTLPAPLPDTVVSRSVAPALRSIELEFAHTLNEEHVEIRVIAPMHEIPLKARAHGYLLLTLARLRLADAGAPPEEAGWVVVDDLVRMLRCEENHLNVDIYRARRQLSKAGVRDAAGLVERRSATREVRIGVERLHIRLL